MEFNKHIGITIPAKALEGAISIVEGNGVQGDITAPVVATPIKKGDAVALVHNANIDGFVVQKATGASGEIIIGFAHDRPEFDKDPTIALTQNQAIAANALRQVGVETTFTDIRVVKAKASEGIQAGDKVVFGASGFEKDNTNGTILCLKGQTSKNTIIIGE